jgi:ABC-type Fe3+-hydroxamate transport system substrate-binding protein
MKRIIAFILLAAMLCGLAACGGTDADTANTRTITDGAGRQVQVPEKIHSIVCVGVGALRYSCYMGAADLVIGVEDYEVSRKIPLDVISVTSEPKQVKIYIPRDFEYSQYDIDDFIRSMISHARTKTIYDRNIYVMTVSTSLNLSQYCKLVKYITEEWEFCTIIEI